MNLLAIDTSTEIATVALLVEGVLYTQEHIGAQSHAKLVLGGIDSLLKEHAVSLADLGGIIFGRGPGSFTGLRVACSIAKGLAYAHNLPVYPVSTLAAIIDTARREAAIPGGILVLVDARMGQVYWTYALPGQDSDYVESVSEAGIITIPGEGPIHLAGLGWETYEPSLPKDILARIVSRSSSYPSASAMMHIVQQGLVEPVTAAEAMPVYIRDKVTS